MENQQHHYDFQLNQWIFLKKGEGDIGKVYGQVMARDAVLFDEETFLTAVCRTPQIVFHRPKLYAF